MSEDTFETYLAGWRDVAPPRTLAWLFLRTDERQRFGALAALQREWLKAIHEISEPQVAAVKLGWWREEMQRACTGEARHPLTQHLFADARARAVSVASWVAAVDAALLARDPAPAVDFAAQQRALQPLAQAFATLDVGVWFGRAVATPRAAAVATLGLLVADLRALPAEVGHGRSPLPMNLLARHGLTVEALARDGAERTAALHDYAGALRQALADAATMKGQLTLFQSTQLHADGVDLARVERAAQPLQALAPRQPGLGAVLKTWRAARIWRHESLIEPCDVPA